MVSISFLSFLSQNEKHNSCSLRKNVNYFTCQYKLHEKEWNLPFHHHRRQFSSPFLRLSVSLSLLFSFTYIFQSIHLEPKALHCTARLCCTANRHELCQQHVIHYHWHSGIHGALTPTRGRVESDQILNRLMHLWIHLLLHSRSSCIVKYSFHYTSHHHHHHHPVAVAVVANNATWHLYFVISLCTFNEKLHSPCVLLHLNTRSLFRAGGGGELAGGIIKLGLALLNA